MHSQLPRFLVISCIHYWPHFTFVLLPLKGSERAIKNTSTPSDASVRWTSDKQRSATSVRSPEIDSSRADRYRCTATHCQRTILISTPNSLVSCFIPSLSPPLLPFSAFQQATQNTSLSARTNARQVKLADSVTVLGEYTVQIVENATKNSPVCRDDGQFDTVEDFL